MLLFTEIYGPSLSADLPAPPTLPPTPLPLALGDEPLLVSADGTSLYVSEEDSPGGTSPEDTRLRDEIDRRFHRMTPEDLWRLQLLLPSRMATVVYDRNKCGPAPTEHARRVLREAEEACFDVPSPVVDTTGKSARAILSAESHKAFLRVARTTPIIRTVAAVRRKQLEPDASSSGTQPERMFEHIYYYFDPDNKYNLGTVAVGCAVVQGKHEYYMLARWGERLESFEVAARHLESYTPLVYRARQVASPVAFAGIVGAPAWLVGDWWVDLSNSVLDQVHSLPASTFLTLVALAPWLALFFLALDVALSIWPDANEYPHR